MFVLQLDETTDVTNCCQLLAFVSYIKDDDFKKKILFSDPLGTATAEAEIFEFVNFFSESEVIHRQALAAQFLPTDLIEVLDSTVEMVNFIVKCSQH